METFSAGPSNAAVEEIFGDAFSMGPFLDAMSEGSELFNRA
jgi:hypothetical protein